MLRGFTGILQVDGYAAYKRLARRTRPEGPLVLAHRWAHGRRQLRELFDRDGSAVAEEGLKCIAELYAIEADLKGQPPEVRRAARQERAKPLGEDFGLWLARWRARLSAKSRAGEKLAYFANHWDRLRVYLEDGRVDIDSNAVENTIRPIASVESLALFFKYT